MTSLARKGRRGEHEEEEGGEEEGGEGEEEERGEGEGMEEGVGGGRSLMNCCSAVPRGEGEEGGGEVKEGEGDPSEEERSCEGLTLQFSCTCQYNKFYYI